MPSGRKTIKVGADLSQEGTHHIKVVWTIDNEEFPKYSIPTNLLHEYTKKIRAGLACLTEHYIDNGNRQRAKAAEILASVSDAGVHLYESLFRGDKDTQKYANHVRMALNRIGNFTVDFNIDFPLTGIAWGLVFTPPVPSKKKFSFEAYRNFWCIKHSATVTYGYTDPVYLHGDLLPVDGRKLAILCVFDRKPSRAAQQLYRINWQPRSRYFEKSSFLKGWHVKEGWNKFFYFFCHSNGFAVDIDGDPAGRGLLSATEFQSEAGPESSEIDWIGLVFFNGCSTAVGETEGTWLQATMCGGFRGFLGTEQVVPTGFAWLFGLDFVHNLLASGREVTSVLATLRRKHWPLSLLYGVFCDSRFRFTPLRGLRLPKVPHGNFSKLRQINASDDVARMS